MIYKDENNKAYIGYDKTIFDIASLNKVEDIKQLKEDINSYKKFSYYMDILNRLSWVFSYINEKNLIDTKIIGRIYSLVGQNNQTKVLKKEFICKNLETLDKNIGNLNGLIIIEFILIDPKIIIQDIIEFCRLRKVKYDIFTLFEIEENEIYAKSNNIKRLEVPKFFKRFID